ncbi:MAG: hypothetical protein ACM3QS_18100 [Bacteroidota bacterium]
MQSRPLRNLLFGLVVAGFLLYAYRYIELSSVVVDGRRYYILFDDAMISMRYAYNLAHGLGLVWNAGERVEGFTNPLWVGLMALVHLLPIPLSMTGLVIQWTGALLLAFTLFFVRRIVEYFSADLLAMLGAVALTAFYAPLISWSLLGMEVSLLALILAAAVYLILIRGENFNPWIYVLLAVSTLVRFDMAVPYLVIWAALFLTQKEHRRQHLIWGLGLLVLFLAGQTLARYFYYGAWLPNTYYLKVQGWPFALRILRGLYALVQFVYYSNWLVFLLPLTLLLFRRDWKVWLLLGIILGQLAYSVYVGGDAWEEHGGANRYIAIAMPLFFAVLMLAVEEIRKRVIAAAGQSGPARFLSRGLWLVLFLFSLLNFNALVGDWKSIERWSFQRRPDYTAGSEHNLRIALALGGVTLPHASVAVVGAGTIPYLLPDRYAIDILGKADPLIAHEPVRAPMSIEDIPTMRPGHMKWDYAHTFGQLKPDVIVSIWEGTSAEAAPYLQDYVLATIGEKIKVFLRKGSPAILWDRVIVNN